MVRHLLLSTFFLGYMFIGHWVLSNINYAGDQSGDAAGRGMAAGFTAMIYYGIFFTTLIFFAIASIMWAIYLKNISDKPFEYAYLIPMLFTLFYFFYIFVFSVSTI